MKHIEKTKLIFQFVDITKNHLNDWQFIVNSIKVKRVVSFHIQRNSRIYGNALFYR